MTKAQKALLEGLVAGLELVEQRAFGHYATLGYKHVHMGTFKSAKRRGWIVDNSSDPYVMARFHTITAAGRAALEEV